MRRIQISHFGSDLTFSLWSRIADRSPLRIYMIIIDRVSRDAKGNAQTCFSRAESFFPHQHDLGKILQYCRFKKTAIETPKELDSCPGKIKVEF